MLKYILDSIISDTQSGFIKGRYIGGITRFIYDLMYYTESHNIQTKIIVFALEFDRPDFGVGLYLYSNLTELNNFWRISTYRNIFLHHSTAVVSRTLIQFEEDKQHIVE